MRKKLVLVLAILFIAASQAKAVDIQALLSQIGFNVFSEKDAKTQITKVLEKQEHYANKKNFNKLRTLYTKTYANYDGIGLDEYMESLKKSSQTHKKLIYKTTINSISVHNTYATVEAVDSSEGITKETYEKIPGEGIVTSSAKSIYYMKKEDGEWKIDAEMAYQETSSLKYGSAKEIEITIEAPDCVKANTEYNIKVSAKLTDDRGIIASIISEPIQYPHAKTEDIFRTMKRDGELERIVTSNNEGKNEMAFASIAIAKASVTEKSTLDFVIDGVAFVSSRVNVIPNKVVKNEQEK